MPWCPNCKEEYIDGFKICSVCKSELVNEIEGNDILEENDAEDEHFTPTESEFLFESDNDAEFSFITNALEVEGIPFSVYERGSGGYMRIYLGINVMGGKCVFVSKNDFTKAKEIFDEMQNIKSEFINASKPEDAFDEAELEGYENLKKPAVWSIRIYLAISFGLSFLGTILFFIFSFINNIN